MASQIVNPYQNFMGLNAVPIQNGYIYIGVENQDPESYPIAVYWDNGLTIPASQPIRTIGGYYSNGGTPGQLFAAGRYSIRVKDSTGTQVFYSASSQFAGAYLSITGGDMTGPINWAKGTDIPSAALTDIASAAGNYVVVTGTTTITALGTAQAGAFRLVRFAGALTLTHNATSLILPSGNNIQVNIGDVAGFVSEGGGNWRLVTFLSVGGTPNITSRQAILYGATDSSGAAAFLSAGTGLSLNLSATAKALRVTFAAGLTDYVSTVNADVTGVVTGLAANSKSYISVDYSSPNAMIWNKTLAAPQSGYTYTRSNQSLLHFGGTVGSTSILDDFGNAWSAQGGAKLVADWSKFGGTALGGAGASNALNGTADYIKTTAITSLNNSLFTIRGAFRLTSLPTAGTTVFLFHAVNAAGFGVAIGINNTAGTVKLAAYASSNGTSWNILNGALATVGTIAINTDYYVNFNYNGSVYTLYQDGNSQLTSFSLNKVSGNFAQVCLGSGNGGANTFVTGYMDEWEILPYFDPVVTVPTVAANIATQGYCSDWFSLADLFMYQVSGASPSAGSNPTFTAKNRVYVGEAVTGSSAVTSVTNYSIASVGGGLGVNYQVFTASNTWNKPSGYQATARVQIQAWGAGGGGGAASGGGGGAYAERWILLSDLTSSVSVTVPAGGATSSNGGNTTFGSYLTAYGGGGGGTAASASGGGGGSVSAAALAVAGTPDGGMGGSAIGDASALGGGGGGTTSGGSSAYGGGGGCGSGSAGTSKYGGNGGAAGVAGTAPAGGGGANAIGGRGEVRVTVFP